MDKRRHPSVYLIEIIVFICLMSFAIPAWPEMFSLSEDNDSAARNQDYAMERARRLVADLKFVLEHYKLDNKTYPTTEQGLTALVKKSTIAPIPDNWRGPYIGRVPLDPWNKPFHYVCPGLYNKEGYDLTFYGPDGKEHF